MILTAWLHRKSMASSPLVYNHMILRLWFHTQTPPSSPLVLRAVLLAVIVHVTEAPEFRTAVIRPERLALHFNLLVTVSRYDNGQLSGRSSHDLQLNGQLSVGLNSHDLESVASHEVNG